MTESELISEIKKHRELYWNNEPLISDIEYDKLILQLKKTNPDSDVLTKIESNADIEKKIHHDIPMLSLDKVFDYESILNWALKYCRNREELLTITPKYDGISARYYTKSGILATRGDGEFGEDITDKLSIVDFKYPFTEDQEYCNGEIVIDKEEFENIKLKFKRKDGKSYSNPRNFVGGVLNSKEIDNSNIKLDFVRHDAVRIDPFALFEFTKDKWESSVSALMSMVGNYQLDGIVIEIVDKEYSNSLGFTSHHPRSKIAFKFEDEGKYTKINDIHFSCGKRKITPVALIDPITINNVTIKRVSLHNAKMLIDNDVHIGDIVKVVRSGDVIPYIAEFKSADENRKKITINRCPSCNHKVIYKEPDLICNNANCEGSNSKLLYQSIQTLGIDNIGLSTVENMIEVLEVKTIEDILELTEEDLIYMPNFGSKMVNKIYNNIQNIKNSPIEDYKLLACLNIPGIGNTLSKVLLQHFTLNQLLNYELRFTNIDGIGDLRSDEIVHGLVDNYNLLQYLMNTFNFITTKTNKKKITNGTICFTGKFDCHKSVYYDKAIASNYEVVEDVTKDTSFVVVAGPNTSKASKARKYGIRILNIQEFLDLIKI